MPPSLQGIHERQILQVSESGLEDLWVNWAEYWDKWNATTAEAREPVIVRGLSFFDADATVVFVIYLASVILPILVFICESYKLFFRILLNIGKCRIRILMKTLLCWMYSNMLKYKIKISNSIK